MLAGVGVLAAGVLLPTISLGLTFAMRLVDGLPSCPWGILVLSALLRRMPGPLVDNSMLLILFVLLTDTADIGNTAAGGAMAKRPCLARGSTTASASPWAAHPRYTSA